MKSLFGVAVMLLLFLPPGVRAQTADDQYVGIYNLIQQGDAFYENGQMAPAFAKYSQAQGDLKRFQAANPDWNVKVVSFRQRYLAAKIALISSGAPPPVITASVAPTNPPPALPPPPMPQVARPAIAPPSPSVAAAPPPVNRSDDIIRGLQEQLRQEEADRAQLQAKLKEALSAQPAAVDPRDFYQAQAQILALQKENELLKVSLEQSKNEKAGPDAAMAAETQRELATARRQATALAAANAALTAENASLHLRVGKIAAPDADTAALREENAVLKKQVAELKKPSPSGGDLERKLLQAQAQIAALESDKEILDLQKIALENQVKQSQTATNGQPAATGQSDNGSAEKIRLLEAERDSLQMRLDVAMSEIAAGKSKSKAAARLDEASRQLDALHAQIEILEARPDPYTPEELALLSKSQGTMLVAAVHRSGRRSVKELPDSAIALLADAKRDVANQDYAGAEEKYLQIVKSDPKNPAVLTDLALIQVNLNHTDAAEKNIRAALALEPDNDYSLFVLGRLWLAQGKYDEALDALSRAAQINPEDAEIQNNLGVALSEKGLRVPAEAALRKAVQIDPGCADAHANLAFVYITQHPPLVELARWHYEKALAAGHPHNAAIEKLIEQTDASSNTP
jgi:tetratricopeptide (TPR) repeat protein